MLLMKKVSAKGEKEIERMNWKKLTTAKNRSWISH